MSLREIIKSERRFHIVQLISAGWSNEEIAKELKVCTQSVKNHLRVIYDLAGCSRASNGQMVPRIELAVRYAIEEERGLYVRQSTVREPGSCVSEERGYSCKMEQKAAGSGRVNAVSV